jgi:nucleoside-diphosphate-sugar epimerase
MKLLVTGGGGFIGSHLVGRLLSLGHQVRVLDNFETGRRENLAAFDGVEVIAGDLLDPTPLARALAGVEAVFHLAALPSVPRSWTDPVGSLRANAMGSAAVAKAAVRAGVGSLVYSSSSSVYGDQPGECRTEDLEPRPISPYGCSKLLGEEIVLAHASSKNLRVLALRYFNVFGPRQDPNSQYSAVIPKFIGAALRDQPVVIFGDGRQSRDFTPVSNVVEANVLALQSSATGQCLNIACGRSVTLLELVDAIAALNGRPLAVTHDEPRPGDIGRSLADCTLAGQVIGYRPLMDFETGLQLTYEHYATN